MNYVAIHVSTLEVDSFCGCCLELSSLEKLSIYRKKLCDRNAYTDIRKKLHLRLYSKFSVPLCNKDRFKKSFINITASRYDVFYCKYLYNL